MSRHALAEPCWPVHASFLTYVESSCPDFFLRLAANLGPSSPPTGQTFSENCNQTKGFSHVRLSPRLSEPRFAMLPACYCSERERNCFSIYHLHPRPHLHVVCPALSLQAVLPSVNEGRTCTFLRGGSTVSGPHLSVFTVPALTAAGFIGDLGPVKKARLALPCVHTMERVLGSFRPFGCFCFGVHMRRRQET